MSLKGNLSSVNLTEIFQMLSLSAREGTLFIYEGARKRAICFTKEGVSIRSRERNEGNLIGKILVRLGRIEESDLQRAIEERRQTESLLGDVLVQMGGCSRDDVELAFRIQSEEDIQELFLNRSSAQFEYVDGYFPESEFPYVNLNVNSLLIEIARRTDEWEYIRRRIRSPREIYRFTGVEGAVEADVLAECYAHRVDPLIDGTLSTGEIMDLSYVNKFEICKLLAAYLDAGIIELVPADAIRKNARHALRMDDAESAIRHYEYLMSGGEFPLEVMGEAAEAHEAMRDFAEAAALLRRLSEELVRAGDYRGAIDSLRRVSNYPSPEPEALSYLMDLVFEDPRAAMEFAGHIVEAGKTLIAYYLQHDQRQDALDLLDRLIPTFPDEVAFALSLVNVYYEDGQIDRAIAECESMASAFLKQRRAADAVCLYKKLLVMDPERQDARDKIRKLTTGKRRRSGALPRIAVALAVSLLLGGAAIVMLKREGPASTPNGGIDRKTRSELLGRAVNEQAQASAHGERAVGKYTALMQSLSGVENGDAQALVADLAAAEESYRLFVEHAERTNQLAETIRTQTTDEESRTRARSMLAGMEKRETRVDSTRGRWRAMAQAAAVRFYDGGSKDYKDGKLNRALHRFGLARALATRRKWKVEVNLDRYITNIRSDVAKVAGQLKDALEHERQGAWTAARRIYLELLRQFPPETDLVGGIRLPLELLSVPPGAIIYLDGAELQERTPAFVRLDPFKETVVELKKPTFRDKTFRLGPFPAGTDPAKYTYPQSLLKAETWTKNVGDQIESMPAVWGMRAACVGRNGHWYVLNTKSGKRVAADKLDTFDGVSAGIVSNGTSFFVSSLDGKLFWFNAVTCKPLYTFTGFDAGIYATPAIADGVIYIVDDAGWVSARSLKTRKRLWRKPSPAGVRAAPVLHGEDLVVLSTSGDVTVFRRETGDEVIRYKLKGTFARAPAPAGKDDLVFATEDGQVYGVERITGQIRWDYDLKAPVTYTAPVRGRAVFFSPRPNELIALDTQTGDVIYHSEPGGRAPRTEVAASDRIFFVHGRTLWAFARGADGYGLAWSFKAKGRILSGPVVDAEGEGVYFGDEKGNFYRLEANG